MNCHVDIGSGIVPGCLKNIVRTAAAEHDYRPIWHGHLSAAGMAKRGKKSPPDDDSTRASWSFLGPGLAAIWQLLIPVAVGGLWTAVLYARFSHQLRFDRPERTEAEELQAPVSDSAFYLSYYYDVVRAPSLLTGLNRLVWDDRSEAPEVVNALQKFNVVPELCVAALRRFGVGPSPFGAYVWSLISSNGMGCFALVLTAGLLGGGASSLVCGSLYAALCFGGSQAGTRLGGASMALREHWGVPALMIQNLFLSAVVLQRGGRGRKHRWWLLMFAAGTTILELSWQFAPFLLLLQLLASLGAHVLGRLNRLCLGEVALGHMLGTAAALAASFGNRMLLCSPFLALATSTSVICLLPLPSFLRPGTRMASSGPRFIEAAWAACLITSPLMSNKIKTSVSQWKFS
eukprot:s40_g7.t1